MKLGKSIYNNINLIISLNLLINKNQVILFNQKLNNQNKKLKLLNLHLMMRMQVKIFKAT